jgi:pyridoxamine 5'-phosphate oxidase
VDPLAQLSAWIEDARAAGHSEPEAMALATLDVAGGPAVRFVLCKGIDAEGIRFFTNYESRKGLELAKDPRASAAFHWERLKKQVRVEGSVRRLSAAESDAYFASRPRGSQIASSVSPQSRPIASLDALRLRCLEVERELAGRPVIRPSHWGGFALVATSVELWVSGADRLHDRVRYQRSGSAWTELRLAP